MSGCSLWISRCGPGFKRSPIELGNLGDHKSVGEGVWEARLMFGSAYRVYFAKDGGALVLLLAGGNKSSQKRDVARARDFWADYLRARRGTKK